MSIVREKHRILYPEKENENGEDVVMIHGLFVGAFILKYQAEFFRKRGYRILLYDYPSFRKKIHVHSENLALFLNSGIPDSGFRIHFLTHSMGGLLLRSALAKLNGERKSRLGRIVMIAPPNHGSDVAASAVRLMPGIRHLIAPIHDLSSAPDSFANICPVPKGMPETGIIGAGHDHQVRPEYTHLRGECGHIMLSGTHTGILFRRKTAEQAYHFIKYGKFKEDSNVGTYQN